MASPAQKPWLPKTAPPDLTFINANIVDVERGKIIPNATVKTSGGRIQKIITKPEEQHESKSSSEPAQSKSSVIDLGSAYLCPGFIDLHVHLTAAPGQPSFSSLFSQDQTSVALRAAYVAKSMLYRGFTTVRDTGGANASLRSAIAENLIPGPRLFIAGKALSQTGGHADLRGAWQGSELKCCDSRTPGFGRVCDGVPQCLEAARDELRQGADFLKVMCGGGVVSPADPLSMLQFTSGELQAITRTAESIGTYVTAHAYTDAAIRHAVTNGCKGIEHGNFITRPVAEWLQSNHPDVTITPTLATCYAMDLPENRGMFDESSRAKNTQVLSSGLKSLSLLHSISTSSTSPPTSSSSSSSKYPQPQPRPLNIAFGTDLLSHMQTQQTREFRIRGSVLPASEVLRQATVNSARVLHSHRRWVRHRGGGGGGLQEPEPEPEIENLEFGIISPGAFADLLIFRAGCNPISEEDGEEGGASILERFGVEISVEDDDDDDSIDNDDDKDKDKDKDGVEVRGGEKERKNGKRTGLALLKEGRVVWSFLEGLDVDEVYR